MHTALTTSLESIRQNIWKAVGKESDISVSEVAEDYEAEVEAMENAVDVEEEVEADPEYLMASDSHKKRKVIQADLERHVEKASEHVVVPGTLRGYIKYVSKLPFPSTSHLPLTRLDMTVYGLCSRNSWFW